MATVPSPRTRAAAEIATAAHMNSEVRDAINFLIAPPRCHAYQNAAQTLTTSTFTSVLLDTEEVDTDAIHSTVTNTSRFTIATAGRYRFIGQIDFASNASGYRIARLTKNGSGTAIANNYAISVGAAAMGVQVVDEILCAAGDYIELQGWQNSGGNLALVAGAGGTFLHAVWVSTT